MLMLFSGLLLVAATIGNICLADETTNPQSRDTPRYVNGLYYGKWGIYKRSFFPHQVPVSQITHLLYAFSKPLPDGTVVSGDPKADEVCVEQIQELKRINSHLKVLISIGGGSGSRDNAFKQPATRGRTTFARTAVQQMLDWGFDGIDMDWEYPLTSEDANDYLELLREVRGALDQAGVQQQLGGDRFLLTLAAPAREEIYGRFPLAEIAGVVDFFNLMGYDLAGEDRSGGDGRTNNVAAHQANLYPSGETPAATPHSVDRAVRDYLARGVPADKIVLGVPAFGRAFEQTDGLGRPFVHPPRRGSYTPGWWDYKDLPIEGEGGVFRDDEAVAVWRYDACARELISYDDPGTVRDKVDYLRTLGLRGVMFWEAAGDRAGEGSLVGASALELGIHF